jgi:hypothetical protein
MITAEATLDEIDEALAYLRADLLMDQYGNRMNWRKRQTILEHIDDLLDQRLLLTEGNREDSDRTTLSRP